MSEELTLARLEARVRTLERARQRWRLGGLMAVLLSAALVLGAQISGPRSIEAQGFILRDASGAARARLGMVDGAPSLALYDGNARLRVAIAVEAEGPILNLFNGDGTPRLVIGARGDQAFIILRDADGAPRAAMAGQEDGSPCLYLLDAHLNPLFRKP